VQSEARSDLESYMILEATDSCMRQKGGPDRRFHSGVGLSALLAVIALAQESSGQDPNFSANRINLAGEVEASAKLSRKLRSS
jgi:hypothetical protein